MKSKKAIGIIIIIFLQANLFFAQSSFEIEGIYTITSEKFVSESDKENFDSKLFNSFGVSGKRIFKSNIFVKGGLHLKSFGTKFDVEETTIQIPDGTGEFYEVNWNAKSVDIPINVGFYFLNTDKLRLGISMGGNNSFIISQSQKTKGIESDIEVYNDYVFQLNSNLEIGIKLTNKIILNIVPVLQRQINSNFVEYKQRGIGCQIGMSYNFKEK